MGARGRPERNEKMSKWEPKEYVEDPTANAQLNIAEALAGCADGLNGLLYGLKYSKGEGMSIAESIEVSGKRIAESLDALPRALAELGDRVGPIDHDGEGRA